MFRQPTTCWRSLPPVSPCELWLQASSKTRYIAQEAGAKKCKTAKGLWEEFQGTNQTFVFTTIYGEPRLFRATGANSFFYLCLNDLIALGRGVHFALCLNEDLLSGTSGPCETFGNLCLAHDQEFELKNVELLSYPRIQLMNPGHCLCQQESTKGRELGEIQEDFGDQNSRNGVETLDPKIQLQKPLPNDLIVVSVSEWQTVISGKDGIGKWLLNCDNVEIIDRTGPSTFKGVYRGEKVGIVKLKGCEKGNAYEFELRKDLLELMTCGHKNILQFYGVFIDENQGLCVVTKLMDGGSVHDLIMKNKRLQTKEILRIATDVEGIKFMNDHGVSYRDLNTQRILLDKRANACLGDMGIVIACNNVGEAMEYETDGYRWLAPEVWREKK